MTTSQTSRTPASVPSSGPVSKPTLVVRVFHLAILGCLAVAAPLLDLLATHAEFLVAHRLEPARIAFLVAILVLGPALPLAVVEVALGRLSRRWAQWAHLVFVTLLVVLISLPMVGRFGLVGFGALAAAGALGAAVVWAYARRPVVRLFVGFLGIALVAIPAGFFMKPKIVGLVWDSKTSNVDDGRPTVDSDTPIVFVVFDEFSVPALVRSDGSINRHRYPNLAALADRSLWFPNAEAVAYSTERAVPAIVTGRTPNFEQLPSAQDHPENLFTLFGRSHDVYALEPITHLCPTDLNQLDGTEARRATPMGQILADLAVVYLHVVMPRPWRARLPPIDMGWRDFLGEPSVQPFVDWRAYHHQARSAVNNAGGRRQAIEGFLRLLDRPPARSKPPLIYMHSLLPHRPLEYLPSGRRYPLRVSGRLEQLLQPFSRTEQGASLTLQRYLLQTGWVDRVVGQMVDRLEASGLFDRALIVVVGDHGISFQSGRHHRSLVNGADPAGVLPVPLWIKPPHQTTGRTIERTVRTIDVLPTVVDLLDLDVPWPFDGRSALADGPPRGRLRVETPEGFLDFGEEIHRQKLELARSVLRRFGSGEDARSLFAAGSHPQLVDRPVDALRRVEPAGGAPTVQVAHPESLEHIERDVPVIPALISGLLPPDGGSDRTRSATVALAIALDGVVRATTEAISVDGSDERVFSALVPESSLGPGSHRLEIFEIWVRDEGPVLVPLSIEPVS